MEVHHSHHHTGHVKKKFQEYFSEFLMLFAAVTLGFFAENKREHYVEREREHQYMQSLYEDLKRDTAEIHSVRNQHIRQIGKLDTTINLLFEDHNSQSSIIKLYELNLGTLGNRGVKLVERTTAQLKNAGGMRLIENKKVSDQIAVYWHWAAYLQSYGETTEELKLRAREKSYSIFNQSYYAVIERDISKNRVKPNAKLMTNDFYTLTEYANRLMHVKNSMKNVQLVLLNETEKVAVELMEELKNEYQVK